MQPPVVRLGAATVRYGPVVALDGVDLDVGPGERVGLLGPSGAGKSTLLQVLHGLVRLSSGSASVLGRDPSLTGGRSSRRLRSSVAMVHQRLDLAGPLRVVHNVNAGRLARWSLLGSLSSLLVPSGRGEVAAALAAVGLEDLAWARTDQLSGGEQQRVAVARVLLQQPALVLADEPVASVDPGLSERVLGLLCGDAPWTTVVSLHEPELARRYCQRLVGLRGGRVVFDRPATEVDDDDLAELYRSGPR